MVEAKISVEDRLTRIEAMLEKISQGVDQAPTMLAMVTDSIDEIIDQASRNGVKFEDSLNNGLKLLGKLSDPKIADAVQSLLGALEQGPALLSMAVDSADEVIQQANQGKISVNDRLNGMLHLVTVLSEPEMIQKVDDLLKFSSELSGLVAMGVDSVDELMASNPFDPNSIQLLTKLSQSVSEAQKVAPANVGGIFGIMRTINDPDRQKALGLLMNILKQFGKKI